MLRSSFLCSIKRKKQLLEFDRHYAQISVEKRRASIDSLQHEIDQYTISCLEECSFENRKDAFQNKTEKYIEDEHVINYIMSFDKPVNNEHECVRNHKDFIKYLERKIQREAEAIRSLHELYEQSLMNYLWDTYHFVTEYGAHNLEDEYKFVEQTL